MHNTDYRGANPRSASRRQMIEGSEATGQRTWVLSIKLGRKGDKSCILRLSIHVACKEPVCIRVSCRDRSEARQSPYLRAISDDQFGFLTSQFG